MTKMFYYIGCVIVSILICNISAKSVKTRDVDNEPKRCCWTSKFSGDGSLTLIQMSSTNSNSTDTAHMVYRLIYDEESGLMGRKGRYKDSTDRKVKLFWQIFDMQLRHSYEIEKKPQTCSPSSSFVTPTVCIPETAKYVSSNTTQLNNKEIITDTWMYTHTDEDYHEQTVYTTVTRDDLCIPVFTKILVTDIEEEPYLSMIVTQTISKVVPEIQNKSIIELPEQCLTDQ